MKKRIFALLLGVLMLFSLLACASEKHELLYLCEADGRSFCARGENGEVKQIVVKARDDILFARDVTVDSSVGTQNGTYGLTVTDLNFDGAADILLMQSISGESVFYRAWLWNVQKETYSLSESLSSLCNIKPIPERGAILAFSHGQELRDNQLIQWSDSATQYVWKSGELIPERQIQLTYYADVAAWCLTAKIYNPQSKKFDIDISGMSDRWFFSQEELSAYDLSQLYYYR